jgi:hypothetical protein
LGGKKAGPGILNNKFLVKPGEVLGCILHFGIEQEDPVAHLAKSREARVLEGFEGKLTTSKWAALTKSSQDTALRDIQGRAT